jgi:SEC-C motif-containing protein
VPSPGRCRAIEIRTGVRGISLIVNGKKKKGFAELMGGGGEEEAVVVKSNGTKTTNESDRCPCGGGGKLPYSRCCKPYHKGEKYPEDCVTLMRSRFSGYAKGEGEYIVKTTHPENPIFKDGAKAESGVVVSSLAEDVRMTCKKVRFYDLEIVSDKASRNDEHLVGFRYKCRVVGQKGFNELPEERHSELSTFRRGANEQWLFLDGITGAVDS